MRSQIYLILIRDGSLALTVGAGLENRLLRDGSRAMALVPTVRGPEFADADYLRHLAIWRSGSEPVGQAPQVVALYEDGLLANLASLGLPAYVGVRDGDEPRIARWAGGPGAIMLPVATARDLVDAIADHTPWSRYAAGLPVVEYPAAGAAAAPVVPGARQPGHGRPSVRSRRVVAVASVAAGPLLLAGLPPVAIAAGGVSQAPVLAATASGAAAPVLAADIQQAPPAAAPANVGTPNTWSNFLTNLGTSIQNYANATVTGADNFLLGQAGNAFSNAFSNYVTQFAPGSSPFWNAFLGSGYIDIGASVPTSPNYGCTFELVVGPTCPLPGTAAAPGTGPGRSAGGSVNHLAPSLTTSPTGGSAQQTGITTSSASSGSTTGGSPGRTATATASGGQLGQTPAKASAGGGLAAASPSQPSTPAPSGTSQSGSAKAKTPVQTRKVAARGGGGGGGGIPHSNFVEPPTSQPIHSTPIPPLNPGTPVTTVPKAPRLNQVGNTDLKTSLPYGSGVGDYYNPDGSDAPDGYNSVQVASADNGSSATDGSGNYSPAGGGGSPADDTGGSQNGAVTASNSGALPAGGGALPAGGGALPAGGGALPAGGGSGGSPVGGNTALAAVSPPTATPIPALGDDQPPTSIGGNTSVFASAGGLMNGGDAGLEGGDGGGDGGSGGGMATG
jgi:hypothetical protein